MLQTKILYLTGGYDDHVFNLILNAADDWCAAPGACLQ